MCLTEIYSRVRVGKNLSDMFPIKIAVKQGDALSPLLFNFALILASKEIGLEVNADETKYMVVSRDQNAGRNHSIKIENRSFEMGEEFKYLGKFLKNQNSVKEETKRRLNSGNACCHSVQNL